MRLSLGTAEDRALGMERLAAVDSWYDQVYAAAKRVDPSATMSKHDTLATITLKGRSLLLTGSMYYGDQQTGKTPDQRIQEFLASVEVEYPAYTPPPDVAIEALVSDLGQNKWGVPIPNSPADQPRIDEYYRRMSALQDTGYLSSSYPVEYPPQFAPSRPANRPMIPDVVGGPTSTAEAAARTTVETSILKTAAENLGVDAGWVEQNKWLVIAAVAAGLYFFIGRSK